MASSDEALVNELAADGGEIHYEKLADRAGIGISTLYDVLNRIPDLVKSDNGAVKFRSEHLKQEILDLIHATGKIVERHQVKVLVREDGTGEFDLNVDQLENHPGEEQAGIPSLRG